MNAVAAQPVSGGRRRWVLIVVGGVAVHVALVFWFGERPPPAGVIPKADPVFRAAVDPDSIRAVAEAPMLCDPTLFALPSSAGFSGEAWLQLVPAPVPPREWTEPPQYLPLATNDLGNFFSEFVATNRHNGSVIEEMLKPRATTADILVLNDLLGTQTVVHVEGPLAARPMLAPLAVPNPVYPDVLTNTVVQLVVNAAGQAESVIVLEGCGVKAVDDQALATAKNSRFRPLPLHTMKSVPNASEAVTLGKMVFQWVTVSPANTNAMAPELP